jgi:hypothetical protein
MITPMITPTITSRLLLQQPRRLLLPRQSLRLPPRPFSSIDRAGTGDRSRTASPQAAIANRLSSSRGSAPALLSVFEASQARFSGACFAALLGRLAGLGRRARAAAKQDKRYAELLAKLPQALDGCSAQEAANVAGALAGLGERRGAEPVLEAIDERADWLVGEGAPQAVAGAAGAFAKLGMDGPRLLPAIDAQAAWFVGAAGPPEVAGVARAFAELGFDAPGFWACLEGRGDEFCAQAGPSHICGAAWALATAGRAGENSGLLRVLWDGAIEGGGAKLGREALAQLAQVRLHAEGEGVELREAPGALLLRMQRAVASADRTGSAFEGRVARHLADLNVEYARGPPGALDACFSLRSADGARTAVECDGPSHYLHRRLGEEIQEHGRTRAKRRLLERNGWRVINVPWFLERKLEDEGGKGALKQWLASELASKA